MADGLRVGIGSQTPLVRMRRPLDEVEAERGPLGDPVPLERLERGRDYSVTPGGVARMIHAAMESEWDRRGFHGEWVALSSGFPRDFSFGRYTLRSATLDPAAKAGYGRFKEVVWEALNGLPPRLDAPLAPPDGETRRLIEDFTSWSRANADRLLERHAREPFDVFYLNDWQQLPEGAMLERCPRVMHIHMPFDTWTPPGWRDWVVGHLRHFEATIVSTRRYARALERAGLERPVHQVYPWVDPSDYPAPPPAVVAQLRERFQLAEDDEIVLNVGRMDPVKGQDRLIRALPYLLKSRPRAKLVLVGNGSFSSSKAGGMGLSKGARWRARLASLAQELGVESRVVFTGHLRHPEVVAAFHTADVFAFPSVAEGFGLAVVEAWIARKPAVVSPGCGVSEIVRDEGCGVIADGANPVRLAEAVSDILASPERAAALGEAGHRAALDLCHVRVGAAKVAEILEAHAERRRPEVEPTLRRE